MPGPRSTVTAESALRDTAARLCHVSREQAINPFTCLVWPEEMDRSQWFMSPELLSLQGTELAAGMTHAELQHLSFFEAVNFFSLNVAGEQDLLSGVATRLYRSPQGEVTRYLHHLLDEENKHMFYFGQFCERYAGAVYRSKSVPLAETETAETADVLFFARVLLFEELVDAFNRRMGRDRRLEPLTRELNRLHHLEEARHLLFGRRLLRVLLERQAHGWSPAARAAVQRRLTAFLEESWKQLFSVRAYRDAGIDDPYGVRRKALEHPAVLARKTALLQGPRRVLRELDLLDGEAMP